MHVMRQQRIACARASHPIIQVVCAAPPCSPALYAAPRRHRTPRAFGCRLPSPLMKGPTASPALCIASFSFVVAAGCPSDCQWAAQSCWRASYQPSIAVWAARPAGDRLRPINGGEMATADAGSMDECKAQCLRRDGCTAVMYSGGGFNMCNTFTIAVESDGWSPAVSAASLTGCKSDSLLVSLAGALASAFALYMAVGCVLWLARGRSGSVVPNWGVWSALAGLVVDGASFAARGGRRRQGDALQPLSAAQGSPGRVSQTQVSDPTHAAVQGFASGLHVAASKGDASQLQQLLQDSASGKGSDINGGDHRRYTALHVACSGGHVDCVDLLLQHGAKTDLRNDSGATAFELAEQMKRTDVLALRNTNHQQQ